MKCLFLYNPNSGKGKIQKKMPLIERILKTRYDEVELYATKSAEDLQRKAAEGAAECDAVVFSGGDGTFNLVLGAIGEEKIDLGYLPSGTVNDVARSLGIPKNIKKALKVVVGGRRENLDCMRVNDTDYAMYVVAAGAFTGATYSTPQKKKRRFGRLGYVFECWKKHMKFNTFPIEVTCGESTEKTKAVLVLVMNGRSVAGLPVNKKASMQDGKMEIAVLRERGDLNFWGRARAFFGIIRLFLRGPKCESKHLLRLRGDKVSIKAEEDVVWDLDGEKGDSGNVEIQLLSKRVTMFVPKNKKI
ncbi:MAG: YegS/Rv2252/BmrU family lipid kinase [Clostridia bacterium]|nr:YegS/Rv2252/BmrU family lipid kinase [Clostridia bacterium]